MFHLRTCATKLRPLTASQTVKTFSQNRPAASRTFGQIRCYTAPVAAEPFLSGTSSNYVEEMYYAWLENPKSVHKVRLAGAGLCVLGVAAGALAIQVSVPRSPWASRQAARSPSTRVLSRPPRPTSSRLLRGLSCPPTVPCALEQTADLEPLLHRFRNLSGRGCWRGRHWRKEASGKTTARHPASQRPKSLKATGRSFCIVLASDRCAPGFLLG